MSWNRSRMIPEARLAAPSFSKSARNERRSISRPFSGRNPRALPVKKQPRSPYSPLSPTRERQLMDREQSRKDLTAFLRTIQRPDFPLNEIDETLALTDSGLIDSLALLQIVTYLEETYNIDFRETGIDSGDLRSVG